MTSDYKKKSTDLVSYIPSRYRTALNTSLLRNLHNKFLTAEESSPLLGYVGDQVANDTSPYIAATDLDRQINSLIPSVYTKLGAEEYVFSFSDVLQKLSVLGIDTTTFSTWGKAQSFNFAPPINLDKFSNYSRYRWYGHLMNVSPTYNTSMAPEFYVIERGGVSDWSTNNYWVHELDANTFFASQGYSFTIDSTVAGTRPIIEFDKALESEMILHIANGKPAASGIAIDQTEVGYKSGFNQKPLFNLYLQNGNHSGFVSPIFYYSEGNEYTVDSVLKTRIAKDAYGDFTFEQGLISKDGNRMLFYKNAGDLKSVWKKGAIESPVYYMPDSDGNPIVGDPTTDEEAVGAWKYPNQMFHNITHENRKAIGYGDLIAHFTSIIAAQAGFTGNPYGANNYRTLSVKDYGLGGLIKDYNTNFSLFLGLTNQLDSSVSGIIDFGKLQYEQLLNAASEYVSRNIADFITDGTVAYPTYALSNVEDPALANLYSSFLSFVAARNDASVFSDTTSSIVGWPATIPFLGLGAPVEPIIYFDKTIGSLVLKHHDGHLTVLTLSNATLEQSIAGTSFLRSTGQTTPGVIGFLPPSNPFKNQFWYDANVNELKYYAIANDVSETFPGVDGEYFYDRTNKLLYQYSNASSSYELIADKTLPWKSVNVSTIINQILLMLENKLYADCPTEISHIDADTILASHGADANAILENELAVYAANHSLDISSGDYSPSDAFTWNYKAATINGVTGVARWFTLYRNYFGTVRPNQEPWYLLGMNSKPSDWDSLYADTTGTRLWTTEMWVMIKQTWVKPLAVNIFTDELLPPYLSPSDTFAPEALLNVIPSGISDGYAFGDLGPTELAWRTSADCNYDKLKACFLLDPINFVNSTWGYNNILVDGYEIDRQAHRKLSHHDFILHGETPPTKFAPYSVAFVNLPTADTSFTLTCIGNAPTGSVFKVIGNVSGTLEKHLLANITYVDPTTGISLIVDDGGSDFNVGDKLTGPGSTMAPWTFTASPYAKFLGLNQWFVNMNRYTAVDMSIALADNILRDWDLKLGYRMSGLINTELLKIQSDQFSLHDDDYEILIKENKSVASHWLNAIRIQLIRVGTTVLQNGNNVPYNKGEDWIFRIETFNTVRPQIDYYEYDPAGSYLTYNALSKKNSTDEWKALKTRTNLVTKNTPFIVTGIENVANVIFGYADKLNEDGWRFNAGIDQQIDAVSGRAVNWQLYIEKFIDLQYAGTSAGAGSILNPFATSVWFNTPHGFVSNLRPTKTTDIVASQSIFDSFGNTIAANDISIIRNDDQTEIQSNVVIGGIHLLIDEYEHIALFDDYIFDKTRSKLLYDPFLGVRVNRLHLTGERQPAFNGRLSFGGHYIMDNGVRRNIEASVKDMINYYDADKMIDNSETAKHARGLLGYEAKSYMSDIELSDKSQFGFWRGLISNKGSNMSVDAFLNSSRFASAKIDEYWAYKLASFGDARQLTFPELKLSSTDAAYRYTKINFVSSINAAQTGFVNVDANDETRWVSQDDMSSELFFAAEKLAEIWFEGIGSDPTIIVDLISNDKTVRADTFKLYAEVYAPTGDRSAFLYEISAGSLINSSTLKVDLSLIDVGTNVMGAPPRFMVKCYGPSRPKFNPAKLIDYKNKVMISDIELWDPARGSHTSEALEVVDIIAQTDPAKYNTSVNTTNNVNYDQYRPWDNKDVGKVWWNTKNLDYIPYSDVQLFPRLDTRLSYWGVAADWSSIQLCEWTESSVHPSTYATLVSSEEGDSSIPADSRASGEVAFRDTYSRDRTWRQRPIAWGFTDEPGSVTPHLSSVGEYEVAFRTDSAGSTIAILSANDWVSTFDDLVIGSKISGGTFHYNVDDVTDVDNFRLSTPFGEAAITGVNQSIVIGSSASYDTPVLIPPTYSYTV